MKHLIDRAGLTPAILKDSTRRAQAINEYNATAGGLRTWMTGGQLALAKPHEIIPQFSDTDIKRYLEFSRQGKQIMIVFAAGRATRMKLPSFFDKLGIAGLTPRILSELDRIRGTREEALAEEFDHSEHLHRLVDQACVGAYSDPSDLSFLQRQVMQLCYQTEQLLRNNPNASFTMLEWFKNAHFAVVANEENKKALGKQLAAIHFGGLIPEHVYFVVQPEEGGLEIAEDGSLRDYTETRWPEGHGKPFIDMQSSPESTFSPDLNGKLSPLGRTLVDELTKRKVERATFAQVNDLHLLEDMMQLSRWLVSDRLISQGAEMIMEMVANNLKQKGGGIFEGERGRVVMRDTIAMKTKDLEAYSVPDSLSRMFYVLTVKGMSRLTAQTLPAYLNERKLSDGRTVLTQEYYSGDASSALNSQAIQEQGYDLDTFKMQSRIPTALEAMARQDAQLDFFKSYPR